MHYGYCAFCEWSCERESVEDIAEEVVSHIAEKHGAMALDLIRFEHVADRHHVAVEKNLPDDDRVLDLREGESKKQHNTGEP